MSSSRNIEDTYESQNDQRLDELHSKLRTLRGVRAQCPSDWLVMLTNGQVTTDIYEDVERQNFSLDETVGGSSVIRITGA